MTALAVRAPLQRGDRWRYRIIATVAALSLGAGIYVIQRMPAAETLPNDYRISAGSIGTLALYQLRAAPAVQYDGAVGAGLRISVSAARLTPASRNNLAALGLKVPNVKGARLQWQARPAAGGRIAVRIRNERQAPDAGMMLRATGSGDLSELNVRAVQTVLTVQVDVASTPASAEGAAEVPVSELKFADLATDDPALVFAPLQFEIPPGESMNLTFDNAKALNDSTFRLGELLETGGSATALSLGRAEVGRLAPGRAFPRLRSVVQGVCASPAGRLLFTRLYPSDRECKLGKTVEEDNLFANAIAIKPRSVALSLEGSGYIISSGRAQPANFWSAIMGNPLIAALMAGLIGAIARPLWRLWVGRDM